MKILVDTHILLWIIFDDPKLTASMRSSITAAEVVYVSLASLWECAIKVSIGKLNLDLQQLTRRLTSFGFELLPIKCEHVVALSKLPMLHRDPFDRLLLAQAKFEPLVLLTVDEKMKAYEAVPIL